MLPLLDLLRFFAGVSVLAFAAYTDWRWRRAPNALWVVLSAVGFVALAVDATLDATPWSGKWPYLLALPSVLLLAWDADASDAVAGALALVGIAAVGIVAKVAPGSITSLWPALVAIPLFGLAIYALHFFGLLAGGADAKAFIALSVLVPFPILLVEGLPPLASPLPGAFTILGDSLLLFLVIPLGFAMWNLAHGDARFPHLFLGTKRRAATVRRGHVWPMEVVREDGTRETRLFASRMGAEEIDATFERVTALGDERVWVAPKVPFMVPMLLGFVCAFLVGDLLATLMRVTLQR